MGLVESFVGVVPAGGGCKEMLYRWREKLEDNRKAAWNAFMNIGLGKLANSPIEANELAMRRATDIFHMNRDYMLELSLSYLDSAKKPPDRTPIALTGAAHFSEMTNWLATNHKKGFLMPHDVNVGTEIAKIVTGGNCAEGTVFTEQDLLDAERSSFIRLAKTPETQARIIAMLDNGKTLRN
jgi:3-hydroxyacyl-CoA dehydrogenase